jgi:hypothetical protein
LAVKRNNNLMRNGIRAFLFQGQTVPAANNKKGEFCMSSSDQTSQQENLPSGTTVQEFLDYCAAERERRLNSGEAFDEETFDQAMQMVINKLRVLADEGWS